jgi:nanoRNase/pAp phosphatase (c-di-AMP/oligoRNAs hydrolase)
MRRWILLGQQLKTERREMATFFQMLVCAKPRCAPQAADLLINLEGISTALIYGITDEAIIMSGRNRDLRLNLEM